MGITTTGQRTSLHPKRLDNSFFIDGCVMKAKWRNALPTIERSIATLFS